MFLFKNVLFVFDSSKGLGPIGGWWPNNRYATQWGGIWLLKWFCKSAFTEGRVQLCYQVKGAVVNYTMITQPDPVCVCVCVHTRLSLNSNVCTWPGVWCFIVLTRAVQGPQLTTGRVNHHFQGPKGTLSSFRRCVLVGDWEWVGVAYVPKMLPSKRRQCAWYDTPGLTPFLQPLSLSPSQIVSLEGEEAGQKSPKPSWVCSPVL